ncbi:MAG: esterase family protein [Paracoccus sp. (in: a-proteobacteria)]|nr:esterase family protein [Paracoccus sp. (in: a-proteobacteria)]
MPPRSLLAAMATLLLLALTPAVVQADLRSQNVLPSPILNRPMPYSVYLPPGYQDEGRDYPVLYLLHGGGTGQPSDWFTLAGIDQMLDRLILSGRIRPLIAVAPDGRRDAENQVATYFLDDADGAQRWQQMFMDDFIPGIESRYPTLTGAEGRAILGISMGGMAATIYQLRHPDRFAGIAALSASFRTDDQLLALSGQGYETRFGAVLGTSLQGSDRLTPQWDALRPDTLIGATDPARFSRVPRLYFDIGSDDPFFEAAANLHLALRDAGLNHRFRVSEGEHDWRFWRGALHEALLHIDAVLTRDYGE